MTHACNTPLRWKNYIINKGVNVCTFWEDHLADKARNLLFIMGQGFDPRMCNGATTILKQGGEGLRNCLLIEYDEGPESPSIKYADLVEKNRLLLNELFGEENLEVRKLQMLSDDGRRIGSIRASYLVRDINELKSYTDIIIDISAIPRGIYFPLVAKILQLIDNSEKKEPINLHVVVTEDIELDKRIQEEGIDEEIMYLPGFSRDLVSNEGMPKVWIPVLGEGKLAQMKNLFQNINADEICPVIPSPSIDPRRGDNLLLEYRELLLDSTLVEPRNIIYASEQNPFEAYREMYQAVVRYNDTLAILGGCRTVISILSSKLLSIGALLASYELKFANKYEICVAHIEAQGYNMSNVRDLTGKEELFTLWLAGECYEE